ncbi:phytase [Variovorax sp. YR752]|uniref:phytase n=1 Tax=Variovorax sp. YR752 TaxID=1884383 RepID=UPI003137EF30
MLPGGAWLALAKRELQLVDPQGAVRARWAVRGESLDARVLDGARGIALIVDSNTERAVPLRFDAARGTLDASPPLPDSGRGIATTCLYRDAQGLAHAFVIAENGFAQQWLLHGDAAPQRVREFAAAPEAEHCRTDDGRDRLFVSEPGGVWLHRAEPEGSDEREAVALVRPHGPLGKGGGELIVRRNDVAVRDGKRLRSFRVDGPATAALPIVMARGQTVPVAQAGDAADDPAIWVHPGDAEASLVLATDKKRGLAVYDLQGRELQFLPVGRINNVDLRQDVRIGNERMDIAAATQRDEHGIVLFGIGADRRVSELARLPLGYEDIYGLCMRRSAQGDAEVIVNDKDGRFLQLRIERDAGGAVVARRLREFRLASQPEGCVVDDAQNVLFAGEEKRGVWALSADPVDGQASDRRLVLPVGGLLRADVEGLAVHRGGQQPYLVVSSQGNDSYVVLDATAPYRVRGAFRVGINVEAGIDGASETDGLDVTAAPLGPGFPQGILVVQDGRKRLPEGPQNFKYVRWEDVARALSLP